MLLGSGVSRLFGLPGGGSISDIIAAAERAGLPFSLTQTETGSAFMAAAQAEITGRPGAIVATLGPGACSAMNGTAHAYLDRVPLIVITDCEGGAQPEGLHQAFGQTQMFAPITKFSKRLRAGTSLPAPTELPPGPIHLEVSTDFTSAESDRINSDRINSDRIHVAQALPPAGNFQEIPKSTRPLFLIGLGARTHRIAESIRSLCENHSIPALVTYKAKGVVPDNHPWFGGVFTHGALEREILEQADLFIGIGLDPVELLPRPWRYPQPIVSITSWPMRQTQIHFHSELVGDIEVALRQLQLHSEWNPSDVRRMADAQREKMRIDDGSGSLLPHRVVELTAKFYPGARATVDAGAHMFPVMALWPAAEPNGVLISNGLATMGFALPSAIGVALLDKTKPVIAFTGDGGLLICLGELRTAVREGVPVRVIVFDDNVLSLIRIKQLQRDRPVESTFNGDVNWAVVGHGFGIPAVEVRTEQELRTALRDTRNHNGPVLIAAKITAETYPATIRALRG
jgi:acetolactate synthase-1/2/3 large subunit